MLDDDLIKAHAENDLASLVRLYVQAADEKESADDIDGACFYLVHAYVFALEAGDPAMPAINQRLVAYGREAPLNP